jgi:uncharacterized Rmd1/YagE family protein
MLNEGGTFDKKTDFTWWTNGCWYMHPWNFSDGNKVMFLRNIQFLLNSFIANSQFEIIVFTWIMHKQEIIDDVLSGLQGDFTVYSFSLIPSEAELITRFTKDVYAEIRAVTELQGSINRIKLYQNVHSIKINVTGCECKETAEQILHELEIDKSPM